MPFNQKPQKFNAKINTVTVGTGDKAVTIGGNSTFPFYTFDAPTENRPKIGVEITDMGLDEFAPGIKAYYEGCTTMAEIAKKAAAMEGGDFVVLNLDGGDPNGVNKSTEELIAVVKEVAEAIDCPLVVEGCKNVEKDAELLPKVAEALQGRNVIVMSEKEENYKAIGAAAGLASLLPDAVSCGIVSGTAEDASCISSACVSSAGTAGSIWGIAGSAAFAAVFSIGMLGPTVAGCFSQSVPPRQSRQNTAAAACSHLRLPCFLRRFSISASASMRFSSPWTVA